MWPDRSYFQPPHLASPNGSVYHFEEWQQHIRDKTILLHEPSGTLYGGETGVVRMGRPLLDLLLVFCAVRGDLKAPEDPPAGYDLTRFPVHEWGRFITWFDWWLAAIVDSAAVLARTSDARRKGLAAHSTSQSEAPEPEEPTLEPVAAGARVSPGPRPAPTNKQPRKKGGKGGAGGKGGKRGGKGKAKANARKGDDEDVASDPEPESEGEEIDFDGLDVGPEGSSDEDEDDRWGTGMGKMGPDDFNPQPEVARPIEGDEEFDKLGLRFRYGFKGDNTYEEQEGNGSNSAYYFPIAVIIANYYT